MPASWRQAAGAAGGARGADHDACATKGAAGWEVCA